MTRIIQKNKQIFNTTITNILFGTSIFVWEVGAIVGEIIQEDNGDIRDLSKTIWINCTASISVYELQYLCKKFIYDNSGYELSSYYNYSYGVAHALWDNVLFSADTEYYAVFEATAEFIKDELDRGHELVYTIKIGS